MWRASQRTVSNAVRVRLRPRLEALEARAQPNALVGCGLLGAVTADLVPRNSGEAR